ncbi:MAG: sulfatase-like hydrolase/transferase [Pirellulales bacterium]
MPHHDRPRFLIRQLTALGILLAAALCGTAPAARAADKPIQPDKPDVLVVLCDQWSPRYLSWDNPQVRTPALDAVAREGMIFDACYTTSPVCMPARTSILTGLYPHNAGHSVWNNANNWHVAAEPASMFRDIRAAGYSTAQIGKLHWSSGSSWRSEFDTPEKYNEAVGLDFVVNVSGPPSATGRDPYCKHLTERGLLDKVAGDIRERMVKWEFEPRTSVVDTADYHDVFVTDRAVEYIAKQPREKPLCLVVGLHAPHPPLDAPGDYATMYDPQKLKLPANVPESFVREVHEIELAEMRRMLANYLGKISLADAQIGRLVAAMQERGTWDNTLFVMSSDHGEMMGAHGALTKGRFYEESARVPLVMRWPGRVKAGRTPALAQLMDVYPTIVEAIGGKLSPGKFAVSQLPVAAGKSPHVRETVLSEISRDTQQNLMVRDARYKWWVQDGTEYLFDLENDPLEQTNLAASAEHAGIVATLRGKALAHLRSAQVNLAAGSKSKVTRLREEEGIKKPKRKKQ